MRVQSSKQRRTAIAVFTGGLILATGTACSMPSSTVATSAKSTGSGSTGSTGGAATAKAAAKAAAKVGDTIALSGFEGEKADVTVVKVVDRPKGADEFTAPESGKRFYAVQFRIKDTGSKAYSDSPSNGAKLVDSAGQSYEADFSDTKAGASFPSAVNIASGSSGLGFITFQVPTGAKITQIQFGLDSGMADQTGQWNVS
ncbi:MULTISPECIES: DUF4352 domain-containing protein [Streptacidiphilus]|uniref:DUF4352 domain-containing protein n=1 Tax=Streptacidiphilus cavernicola TaxID=3342716 RepID=A0ABV6UM13_9ACTN|nr:DUF4352 domain-containing protein [Streptacidiphilus jeojiense]